MKCKYRNGGEYPGRYVPVAIPPHKGDGVMKSEGDDWVCPECGWAIPKNLKGEDKKGEDNG